MPPDSQTLRISLGSTVGVESGTAWANASQLSNLAHPMPMVQPLLSFRIMMKWMNRVVCTNCIGLSEYLGRNNSSTHHKDDCIFRSGNP
jgi:hypothetical protein